MEKRLYEATEGLVALRYIYPLYIWSSFTEIEAQAERGIAAAKARQSLNLEAEDMWFARLEPETLRILEINPGGCGYLQQTEAQLRDRSLADYLQPDNISLVRQVVREAMETGGDAQAFMYGREGRPVLFLCRPTVRDGKRQALVYGHYAPHYRMRQLQVIGEEA